jgi:hypothetical protein
LSSARPSVPRHRQAPLFGEVAGLTKQKAKWFSGGGGLLSDVSESCPFAKCLLSPKTVTVMTSGHSFSACDAYRRSGTQPRLPNSVKVSGWRGPQALGHSAVSGSVGDYFWTRAAGTCLFLG